MKSAGVRGLSEIIAVDGERPMLSIRDYIRSGLICAPPDETVVIRQDLLGVCSRSVDLGCMPAPITRLNAVECRVQTHGCWCETTDAEASGFPIRRLIDGAERA